MCEPLQRSELALQFLLISNVADAPFLAPTGCGCGHQRRPHAVSLADRPDRRGRRKQFHPASGSRGTEAAASPAVPIAAREPGAPSASAAPSAAAASVAPADADNVAPAAAARVCTAADSVCPSVASACKELAHAPSRYCGGGGRHRCPSSAHRCGGATPPCVVSPFLGSMIKQEEHTWHTNHSCTEPVFVRCAGGALAGVIVGGIFGVVLLLIAVRLTHVAASDPPPETTKRPSLTMRAPPVRRLLDSLGSSLLWTFYRPPRCFSSALPTRNPLSSPAAHLMNQQAST